MGGILRPMKFTVSATSEVLSFLAVGINGVPLSAAG